MMERMTEEEFNTKQNELLSRVPAEFRGALGYHAWETGHAYGYEEVVSHLGDLVEALDIPIQLYTQRITNANNT